MAETDQVLREDKALKLAYERGRREAVVDEQLRSHEERLDAINGSVRRSAEATEGLVREVGALRVQIETADRVAAAVSARSSSVRGRWRWLFETLVAVAAAGALIIEAVHFL